MRWFRNIPSVIEYLPLHLFQFGLCLCLGLRFLPPWHFHYSFACESIWPVPTMPRSTSLRGTRWKSHRYGALISHVVSAKQSNHLFQFILMTIRRSIHYSTPAWWEFNFTFFDWFSKVCLSLLRRYSLILDTKIRLLSFWLVHYNCLELFALLIWSCEQSFALFYNLGKWTVILIHFSQKLTTKQNVRRVFERAMNSTWLRTLRFLLVF